MGLELDFRGDFMTFIYIILCVTGGFCLCGAWFGLCALCASVLKGRGEAARLAPLLAGVPFAAVLKFTAGFIPQNFEHAQNLFCAAAVLIAVLASAAIANLSTGRRRLFGRELFWWVLGGAFMEVPQRLFMQGALFAALSRLAVPFAAEWAVLCNAVVWCLGIIVQAMIAKQRPGKALYAELCASFIFSVGVGFAYQQTEIFALCLAAHAAERAIGNALAEK